MRTGWLTFLAMMLPEVVQGVVGERVYIENVEPADSCCSVVLSEPSGRFSMEVCGSALSNRNKQGRSDVSWSCSMTFDTGVVYHAVVGWGNTDFGTESDERYLEFVVVADTRDEGTETVIEKRFEKGVALNKGENTIVCECDGSDMKFFIGNDELNFAGTTVSAGKLTGVELCASGKVSFPFIVVETERVPDLGTTWTSETLKELFGNSRDAMEGFWEYVDRDNDTDYARLGGEYRLALVSDNKGGYDIIYVSGARVNALSWQPGMLKGRLTPTTFTGRYGLEWYDSMLEPVESEVYATVDNGTLMTFHFPLYKSKFRFVRVPSE